MNKVFRVIWNRMLGRKVVASEAAKLRHTSSGKTNREGMRPALGGMMPRGLALAPLAAAVMLASGSRAVQADSYEAGQGADAGPDCNLTWANYGNPGVPDDGVAYDDTDSACAVAIGDGARASAAADGQPDAADGTTAIGAGATADSAGVYGATALGANTYAIDSGVAVGAHATSSGGSAIAIGRQSAAEGQYSMALGRVSYAQGAASMAIGVNSNAQGARAIAIGGRNDSGNYNATTQTRANGTDAIAIGGGASRGARALANNTIALGASTQATDFFDTAIGFEATADSGPGTRGAIALGDQTQATGQQAAAIGSRARVAASQGVAIGNDTSAIGYAAVAIGGDDLDGADSTFVDFITDKGWLYQQNDDSIDPLTGTGTPDGFLKSQARELGSTVVGTSSVAYAVGSTVVGTASLAEGDFSTAIGTMNHAEGERSLAIGAESYAAGIRSMATGTDATASADFSMAVGNFAEATARNSAAVGNSSDALGVGASAFGNFAIADGANATALGGGGEQGSFQGAQATADGATAIGGNTVRGALAEGVNSIAVGGESNAGGVDAIAIGTGAAATGDQSISIGLGNEVSGTGSGAVGDPNIINGSGSYALGNDNTIDADEAGTFGNDNFLGATATGSRIIGNTNGTLATPITAADAFIVGNNANVTVDGGVAIGSGSLADTDSGVAGYDPLSGAPSTDTGSTWLSTASAISVGDVGNDLTRQITGVAAGAADTDAVNVAQLQALGDTPLTFAGDSGTDVERQLGETLNINGGATGTLTSGNIGVVGDGTDTLEIQLAENVDLGAAGSVTTGNSTLDNDGLAIDDGAGNVASYAATGSEVTDGTNTTTTTATDTTYDDGAGTTTVASAGGVSVTDGTITSAIGPDSLTSGNVVVSGASDDIIGLSNTDLAAGDFATAGRAATEEQLDIVNQTANTGWNLTAEGVDDTNVAPGDTVDLSNTDGNIAIAKTGNDVTFDLADDLAVDSVTTGNSVLDNDGLAIDDGTGNVTTVTATGTEVDDGTGNIANYAATGSEVTDGTNTTTTTATDTTYDDGAGNTSVASADGISVTDGTTTTDVTSDGLTISGGPSVTTGGIDAGSQVISNVSDGVADNDAVNVSQLDAVETIANTGWNLTAEGVDETNVAPGDSVDLGNTDGNLVIAKNATDGAQEEVIFDLADDLAVDSVTTGNSVLDNDGLAIDDGAGNLTTVTNDGLTIAGGPSITASGGIDAGGQVISNVADGTVGAGSTEAINGSQLFGSVDAINTVIGGNATVDGNGAITTSDVGGTGEDTIDEAISSVNTAANAGWNVTDGTTAANIGPDGDVTFSGDANIAVAQSGVDDDGQIDITLTPDLNVDSVTTGNSVLDNDGLAIDDGTGNVASYAATGSEVTDGTNTTTTTATDTTYDDGAGNTTVASTGGISVTDGTITTDVTSDGLTITGGPSVTTGGIDAGSQVISNVSDGVADNDAVNVSQLDAVETIANTGWNLTAEGVNDTNVAPGDTVDLSNTDGNLVIAKNAADGAQEEVTFDLADDLAVDSVTTDNSVLDANGLAIDDGAGNVTNLTNDGLTIAGGPSITASGGIDSGSQVISNVADGTVGAGSTEAINGSQLFGSVDSINTVIGGNSVVNADGTITTSDIGGTGEDTIDEAISSVNTAANAGWNVTDGTNAANIGPDGNVTFSGDANIDVAQSGVDDDGQIDITLAPDLNVDSVTTGNSVLDNDGLTIVGGPSITNSGGINAGNQVISNVAGPVNGGDAVNLTYFNENRTRYYSVNDGNTARDNFENDGATGLFSMATGIGARAMSEDAVALGRDSESMILGSVALGSDSLASRATAPTSGTLPAGSAAITFNTTDRDLMGAISVGHDSAYRQVTNVADGTQSQDAVTIRQLQGAIGSASVTDTRYFHANSTAGDSLAVGQESIAVGPLTIVNGDNGIGMGNQVLVEATAPGGMALGQQATVTLADAVAMGTQASATGEQALALGAGATAGQAGSIALGGNSVTQAAQATSGVTLQGVTYSFAGQNPFAALSIGDDGLERTVTNMAAGRIEADSTDGINGSQLYTTNLVLEELGDAFTLVSGDTSETFTETNGTGIRYVRTNESGIDESDAFAQAPRATAVGYEALASADESLAMGYRAVASHQGSVALGAGAQTSTAVGTQSVTIAGRTYQFAGTEPVATVSVGSAGAERTITHVAAGRLSPDSTDAVNGSQLHATNQAVNAVEGRIDGVEGDVSQLGDRVTIVEGDVANLGDNLDELNDQAVKYDTNEDGSVDYETITLAGDAGTTITNVADGDISENSGDAVNGGQLWDLQDQVTNIEQGGSKYFSANSDGPAAEAQGGDSIAMGSGSVAQGDRSVAAGDGARAEVEGGVALGADSVADREGMNGQREGFSNERVASTQGAVSVGSSGSERQITHVAGGTEATDAVNVRQLESVQAGAVNYDRNEDGSVDYSSVTLGREGTPTRMRNVAPGVDATDAANVGQLQELGRRFESELNGVNGRIDNVERNANAGAASAIAAASVPQAFMPGKSMVSVGAGTYSGESAVSVGVSRLSDNGRWVIKLNATGDSQSNFGAGVGAGWHW